MSANRNIVLLGLAVTLSFGGSAFAQNADQLGGAPAQRVAVPDANAADVTQQLTLTVNKSYMIEFDTEIDDVIVGNPAIADIVARDRRRVAVMGAAPGETNIVFLDRSGRKLKVLEVSVTDGVAGMDQLRTLIKRHVPGAKIDIEAINGRIILSGVAPNLSAADRVVQLAQPYAKDDKSVLNLISIQGKDQVALKVRFVEMQRTVIKQMGINLTGAIGFGKLETTPTGVKYNNTFSFGSSNAFPIAGSALGGLAANFGYQNFIQGGVGQSSAGAVLNALERVGVVRTLAEPNLTAISGEAGKFLVGG